MIQIVKRSEESALSYCRELGARVTRHADGSYTVAYEHNPAPPGQRLAFGGWAAYHGASVAEAVLHIETDLRKEYAFVARPCVPLPPRRTNDAESPAVPEPPRPAGVQPGGVPELLPPVLPDGAGGGNDVGGAGGAAPDGAADVPQAARPQPEGPGRDRRGLRPGGGAPRSSRLLVRVTPESCRRAQEAACRAGKEIGKTTGLAFSKP